MAPSGDVLARAPLLEEATVYATIDEQELCRARRLSRHFLDDDPALTLAVLRRILGTHR